MSAEEEQEQSFRELISLANQSKIIKRNQLAKEGSQQAQQQYNDMEVQRQEEVVAETPAPEGSVFGSFIGGAIPDIIEKPASDALKIAYNFYEAVPEVLPWAVKKRLLGMEARTERGKKVSALLDQWFDKSNYGEGYGMFGEKTWSSENYRETKDLLKKLREIRSERPLWQQLSMSVINPVEYLVAPRLIGAGIKGIKYGIKGAGKVGKLGVKGVKEAKQTTEFLRSGTMKPGVVEPVKTVGKTAAKETVESTLPQGKSMHELIEEGMPKYTAKIGENVEQTAGNFKIDLLGEKKLIEVTRKVKDLLFEKVGINALADPTNPAHRLWIAMIRGQEGVDTAAKLVTQRFIGAVGNANQIFNLDENFTMMVTSKTGATSRQSFQEVAQYSNKYKLTTEQTNWFDEFRKITGELRQETINKGAYRGKLDPDLNLLDEVEGEYFPNIWQFFKTVDGEMLRLKTPTKGAVGRKGFEEKTRLYQHASDAYAKGYRGDPMQQVALLWTSMYQRMLDQQLVDYITPYMKKAVDRMDIKYFKQVDAAVARQVGLKKMIKAINTTIKYGTSAKKILDPKTGRIVPPGKMLKNYSGRKAIVNNDLELDSRWQEIVKRVGFASPRRADIAAGTDVTMKRLSLKGKDLRKELLDLREQVQKTLIEAEQNVKIMRTEKNNILRAAGKHPGEFSFPMTGLAGKIGTPEELVNSIKSMNFTKVAEPFRNLKMKEWQFVSNSIKDRTAPGNAIMRIAQGTQATARTMMAGFDLGVYFIHLLPLALTDNKMWRNVVGKSMKALVGGKVSIKNSKFAFKRENVLAKYIDENWDAVREMYDYDVMHGSLNEFVEAMGKGSLLRKAGGIPKIGKPLNVVLDAVERNFESALSMAKVEMWKGLKPMALKSGLPKEEALRQLGSHINKMTGTVSMAGMGLRPTTQQALGGMLMFAPRYRLATYGLMRDIFRGNLQGQLARDAMGHMTAAAIMYYSYLGHHLDQTPNLDPTSGKFLTYKIGNTNVGIGSAFLSTARFMGKIVGEFAADPKTGEARIPSMGDIKTSFSAFDNDDVLKNFVRSQIAPLTGTGWDMISGRNYMGEPTTENSGQIMKTVVAENMMPFWASGMLFDQPKPGWISPPAEFMGLRSFPVGQWDRFKEHFNVYSMKSVGGTWDELNKLKRTEVMQMYPHLQQIQDEAFEISALRERREEVSDYRESLNQTREKYDADLQEEIDRFYTPDTVPGHITAQEFRQRRSELGFALSFNYDMIYEEHQETADMLNEESQNPRAHLEDIAYEAYVKEIIAGDFYNEIDGEFDYTKQQEAIDMFEQEYGSANLAYVRERLNANKPPLLQELDQGRKAIAPYWEIGEIILKQTGHGNLVPKWKEYLKARGYQREEMLEDYPMFKEVASAQSKGRLNFRMSNAKVERFLYRWGYIDSLRHPDNVDRDVREVLNERITWDNAIEEN